MLEMCSRATRQRTQSTSLGRLGRPVFALYCVKTHRAWTVSQCRVGKAAPHENAITKSSNALQPLTAHILPLTQNTFGLLATSKPCLQYESKIIAFQVCYTSNCILCLVHEKQKGKEAVSLKSIRPSGPREIEVCIIHPNANVDKIFCLPIPTLSRCSRPEFCSIGK